MKNLLFVFLIITTFAMKPMQAQLSVRDSIVSSWMFSVKMGGYIPAADLKDRYGNCFMVGLDIDKKTRSNWFFGIDGSFFSGKKVNNLAEIFGDIITDQGLFIGLNGELAGVEFFQRGFYAGGHIGKLIPVFGPNPNSGILIKIGGGYLQNQIHIRKPSVQVPQIEGEYAKGYDRLHSGFALRQQLSYMYSSNVKTINFMLGFEFIEGFTKNQRAFNYDTKVADLSQKLDVYIGIHATWFLPIYDKNQQKFFYD